MFGPPFHNNFTEWLSETWRLSELFAVMFCYLGKKKAALGARSQIYHANISVFLASTQINRKPQTSQDRRGIAHENPISQNLSVF
jgi:hypothetical protein